MKILYYITDHGLGHATRTIAIIRELKKKKAVVVVRNNDAIPFLRNSLPRITIVPGQTDFIPVMKLNGIMIDYKKTQQRITKWINNMPKTLYKESIFIKKENPDLVVSDVSTMPILASKMNNVKSIVVSNFVWSEVLDLDIKSLKSFTDAYRKADLIIKLPFGSKMKFANKKEMGLVAREITEKKRIIRKQLGIPKDKKLVVLAIGGINEKIPIQKSDNIEIIDISDYKTIMKIEKRLGFVEGQNLVNAADLVICKCGYGYISECLSSGVKFRYLLEPSHIEANKIHKCLRRIGLRNMLSIQELRKLSINDDFIKHSNSHVIKLDNKRIANQILDVSHSSKLL